MEYEGFVQKMAAINLSDVVPVISELIDGQFYLYSFIHWTELSISMEALYRGLLSMVGLLFVALICGC